LGLAFGQTKMLLVLKQLQGWMLEYLLSLPSDILIREIPPSNQELFDDFVSQVSLTGV